MIDLDAVWDKGDDLYCELGYRLVLWHMSYTDFQKLAKWLGIYQYVLPADRDINTTLMEVAFKYYLRKRGGMMRIVMLHSHLEANFPLEYQNRILTLMIRRGIS